MDAKGRRKLSAPAALGIYDSNHQGPVSSLSFVFSNLEGKHAMLPVNEQSF
jgi:hypothetical protein